MTGDIARCEWCRGLFLVKYNTPDGIRCPRCGRIDWVVINDEKNDPTAYEDEESED